MSRGTQGRCAMLTRSLRAGRPRTVTLLSAPQSAPRGPHVVPESTADEPPARLVVRVADCCLGVPVIADEIVVALRVALAAAGLPEPKKLEVTPADEPRARRLPVERCARAAEAGRRAGHRDRAAHRRRARGGSASTRRASRGRGSRLPQLLPLPDLVARGARERRDAAGDAYGRGDAYAGLRVNLEFVSVNPTGPLHAGGGRWVAVGDAIANLLAAQGAVVHREYYLNDAGNQLATFGASLVRPVHAGPSSPRTATRVRTSSRWESGCAPSSATTSPRSKLGSGASSTSSSSSGTTSAASASTSTRGSPSAPSTRAGRSARCSSG